MIDKFRQRWQAPIEKTIYFVLGGCGALSIAITVIILLILVVEGGLFFREVSIVEFFTTTEWSPLFADPKFGVWPLLIGTLMTSSIALFVALPLGLLSGIYLSEYASRSWRNTLKPLLELLAGIPTVVFGYFAFIYVTPWLQLVVPDLSGFNALSAGLVMGIMIVPLVSSLSEDAIYAVPQHLKEAAYGLGSRKFWTIWKIIIPSAKSGIAAAFALAVGRAVGETMIVTIAAGQRPQLTFDPRVPIETMTAYIVQVGMGDTPHGTMEYRSIFAVGATLFLVTFGINLLGLRLARSRMKRTK